ncbi:MAG: putative lipid II flippase FtsW [Puniceicoccales bacterium]|jgi:cell division protein FtsW|nr:putative lipid II flippase FtsW [Puniceicoccales bacterium]
MLLDRLEVYCNYFSQRKAGWFILGSVALLLGLGTVILSSASLSFINSENYFSKQLLWCAIGVPFFFAGCLIDLKFLRKHHALILAGAAAVLVAVLIPGIGKLVNGSRRWISAGPLNMQVSEFAKIAAIIWMSGYLEKNSGHMDSVWNGFLTPLSISGVICLLVLLEPDYGTAILIGAVAITLLFLANAKISHLAVAMAGGLALISALIYANPSRMRRIVAFLDVEKNKSDGAYQLWQGMLGFVSGGLFGHGIGQGRQQLTYLPEAHTDFIFPIFSEELGSLAAIAALSAYALLFFVAAHCAKKIRSDFAKFISYGIALLITYQVIINVGVVTGLLPTKGMVLPFISYGGSNLVSLFFAVGLLLNCFSSDLTANDKSDDTFDYVIPTEAGMCRRFNTRRK